ncbi:MAG: class I SAM-dependent methyltransferase [Pseudomonadota bacterium]
MSRESYDQIAAVYATDMGQSMAYDDVGYYRQLCQAKGGSSLELGCGTGRILLPLLKSGIDIRGIDQSPGMLTELRRLADEQQLQPQVSLGTLTDFYSDTLCNTILAPYSVVTYLTETSLLNAFFTAVNNVLAVDGQLVLDTFIPRELSSFNEFRLDYRRPHGAGILQREKRIERVGYCNHIERRYTLLDDAGEVQRTWTTLDIIRPWTEVELVTAAQEHNFNLVEKAFDFSSSPSANPQFVILHFQQKK